MFLHIKAPYVQVTLPHKLNNERGAESRDQHNGRNFLFDVTWTWQNRFFCWNQSGRFIFVEANSCMFLACFFCVGIFYKKIETHVVLHLDMHVVLHLDTCFLVFCAPFEFEWCDRDFHGFPNREVAKQDIAKKT